MPGRTFLRCESKYDYNAVAEGELSVNEDQLLMVFGSEEDGWLLVQDQVDGRLAMFPGNYVQSVSLFSLLTASQRGFAQIAYG